MTGAAGACWESDEPEGGKRGGEEERKEGRRWKKKGKGASADWRKERIHVTACVTEQLYLHPCANVSFSCDGPKPPRHRVTEQLYLHPCANVSFSCNATNTEETRSRSRSGPKQSGGTLDLEHILIKYYTYTHFILMTTQCHQTSKSI